MTPGQLVLHWERVELDIERHGGQIKAVRVECPLCGAAAGELCSDPREDFSSPTTTTTTEE